MLRAILICSLVISTLCLRAQGRMQIKVSFPEEKIKAKDLLVRIEYIPLETTSDCLIGKSMNVYASGEYIIVTQFFGKAFAFDRKTGHFIHEIGHLGQGPGEYAGFWSFHGFCDKEQLLYTHEWTHWKGYDIRTGKMKQVIKSPHKGGIQNPYLYKSGIYLGYLNNAGNTPEKLILFDKEGVVKKVFPQYQRFERENKNEYKANPGIFYEYGSNIYFQEIETDSVFQVTEDALIPHINYQHLERIKPIVCGETDRFVVSKYYLWKEKEGHVVVYDKKAKTSYVDFAFKKSSDQKLYEKSNFYDMNRQGELIFFLQPVDIIDYIKKHPENKKELDPQLLELQEDDNPMVMILKLKD